MRNRKFFIFGDEAPRITNPLVVAVGATGVACLAAVVPAVALRRLPLAGLLAEE